MINLKNNCNVKQAEKTEKAEKIEKIEKVEKVEKVEKAEKVEKTESSESNERTERNEKNEKRKSTRLLSVWDIATQKKRQLLWGLSIVVGVVLGITVLLHPHPEVLVSTPPSRLLSIQPNVDAYEAWQANQEVKIHQTVQDIAGLQHHQHQAQSKTESLENEITQLHTRLNTLNSDIMALRAQNQSTQEALKAAQKTQMENSLREKLSAQAANNNTAVSNAPFAQDNASSENIHSPDDLNTLSVSTPPVLSVAHSALSTLSTKSKPFNSVLKPNIHVGTLPAGAFVQATLLTGLDAGAGQAAQANPYPVTLRVMSNAILPIMGFSMKRYHLKGCFVLGSGYGSLSEERVFIRTTHLSCLNEAGERLVTADIKGYVVDSDGKAGLRGKLINRQGAKLGMAFLAGFAGGVGNAASGAEGSSSTSALGSVTTYDTAQALSAGAYGGLGKAGNELSDFYIQMAKSIYPVIVINAGRNVTIDLEKDAPLLWVSETAPFIPDLEKTPTSTETSLSLSSYSISSQVNGLNPATLNTPLLRGGS